MVQVYAQQRCQHGPALQRVWRDGLSELWQLGGQGGSELGRSHGLCPLWLSVGAGRAPGIVQADGEAMAFGSAKALAALVGSGGFGGGLGCPCGTGSQTRPQGWAAVGTGSAVEAGMAFQPRWARHVTIR